MLQLENVLYQCILAIKLAPRSNINIYVILQVFLRYLMFAILFTAPPNFTQHQRWPSATALLCLNLLKFLIFVLTSFLSKIKSSLSKTQPIFKFLLSVQVEKNCYTKRRSEQYLSAPLSTVLTRI
jgi:hypothetical protein